MIREPFLFRETFAAILAETPAHAAAAKEGMIAARQVLEGYIARVFQHEYDHLDGVLFIDRLTPAALLGVKQALLDLERQFAGDRQRGAIPDDQQIASRLAALEQLRT